MMGLGAGLAGAGGLVFVLGWIVVCRLPRAKVPPRIRSWLYGDRSLNTVGIAPEAGQLAAEAAPAADS